MLEIGDDVFEVLATCGDTFLGGDDFDDRLIDLLADEFMQKEQRQPPQRSLRAARSSRSPPRRPRRRSRSTPRSRSASPDIYPAPGRPPCSIQRTLTRTRVLPARDGPDPAHLQGLRRGAPEARRDRRDLDAVILVGGPTRLPIIRNSVRHYFQQEPQEGRRPGPGGGDGRGDPGRARSSARTRRRSCST